MSWIHPSQGHLNGVGNRVCDFQTLSARTMVWTCKSDGEKHTLPKSCSPRNNPWTSEPHHPLNLSLCIAFEGILRQRFDRAALLPFLLFSKAWTIFKYFEHIFDAITTYIAWVGGTAAERHNVNSDERWKVFERRWRKWEEYGENVKEYDKKKCDWELIELSDRICHWELTAENSNF